TSVFWPDDGLSDRLMKAMASLGTKLAACELLAFPPPPHAGSAMARSRASGRPITRFIEIPPTSVTAERLDHRAQPSMRALRLARLWRHMRASTRAPGSLTSAPPSHHGNESRSSHVNRVPVPAGSMLK